MNGYTVSLQGNITGFKKVCTAINAYNTALNGSQKDQRDFINAVSLSNNSLATYLSGLNGAKGSLLGYGISLVGATVKTFALQAATAALNAALTWGISLIVTGVITAITNWINKEEILTQKAEEAQEKINDLNETFKTNQKLVSESAKRYAELAQGVDQVSGKNILLNNDDYEEFLDLSNQLAEAFPTLSRNYTENGDAIVQLSGDVDTIVGSLQNLIEAERELKNQEIADALPDVFKNAVSKSDKYNDEINTLKAKRDTLLSGLNDLNQDNLNDIFSSGLDNRYLEVISKDINEYVKAESDYLKILDEAKIAYNFVTQDPIHTGNFDSSGNEILEYKTAIYIDPSVTEEEIEKAKSSMRSSVESLAKEYERDIKDLNGQIDTIENKNKSNWTSLSGSISAWLNTEDSYKILSDDMQATIQNIVNSLDFSKLDFKNWEDAKDYIQENILDLFQTTDGKEVIKDMEVMFGLKTQFNNDEISVNEYQNKLNEFLTTIESLDPVTQKAIKLLFGISTDDDGNETSDVDTMINNVKSKLQDQFDDKIGELSLGDLKIAANDVSVSQNALISWDELIAKIKKFKDQIPNENHLSFTEYMDNLESSLSSGFDQLDKIYADVLNKEDFDWSSILDNTSFTEAFGNMENVTSEYKTVYDDFIETISNSPDDIGKCQQAFNNLATAYVQNSGALDDLSESTKQATINRLEEWGVSNAEEVVTSALITKQRELAAEKAVLANTTSDLSTVTSSEILQLKYEGTISNETAQDITAFAMQKQIANLTTISTKEDINQLGSLCVMLQATGVECNKLKELIDLLNSGEIMSNERRQTIINRIQKEMEETMANMDLKIKLPEIDYSGADKTKSVLDSAKKSADDLYNDLKSQIKAYLDFMEKSLDAGRIDYSTYCHDVKKYLDDLYNSGKLKAADYFSYIERSLTKQKEIYDKVLSAIADRLQEEIDKLDKQIDAIEKQNDALNEQKDNYDKILSVVSDVYDKQIEELNKQKDALQDQIDALDDQNDALDLQYRKEQALYNLKKAQEQRTKKLYIEGAGYVFKQDGEAIRDAQKDLSDIQTEEIKKKLQDEQDALDKTIEELEKYKALWAEIPDLFEKQQNQQLTTAILGKEYEALILQNRVTDIENFKKKYLDAQSKINNNEQLIKSLEEKKTYYSNLKDQWSALSGEYEKQQNRMYAAQVMGANWETQVLSGRIDVMTKFGNDYVSIQDAITQAQWNATNERIKAYQAEADAAAAAANAAVQAERNKQALKDTSDTEVGKTTYNPGTSSAGMPSNANGKDGGNRYAAATADQRKNNPNTIMSNEQKMTIAASKSSFTGSSSDTRKLFHNIRRYASGGVVKVNPNDVFFKDTAKQIGEDTISFVRDGERILTPVQNKWWEKWTDNIPQIVNLLENIPHDAFTGMNDLVRNLSENNVSKTVSNSQPITISIGDIVLQGVQNPEQLSDAIYARLPGIMSQKFSLKQR